MHRCSFCHQLIGPGEKLSNQIIKMHIIYMCMCLPPIIFFLVHIYLKGEISKSYFLRTSWGGRNWCFSSIPTVCYTWGPCFTKVLNVASHWPLQGKHQAPFVDEDTEVQTMYNFPILCSEETFEPRCNLQVSLMPKSVGFSLYLKFKMLSAVKHLK